MFENFDFDFDDNVALDTSFTPSVNSTQISRTTKRSSDGQLEDTSKKQKLNEELNLILNETEQISVQKVIHSGTLISPNTKTNAPVRSKEDSFISPSRVVKRKFPGPAGLLPETGASNKSILQLLESEHFDRQDTKDIPILSQETNLVFEDGPWKEMSKDFHIHTGESLLEKFNVKWIKRQALKQLLPHKAPFLAAVIQNLDIIAGKVYTINVTLKDSSGDVRGTMLHTLYEEYSDYLKVGSVIVLKHFGVLSAGHNNYCLTITPNNLVSIYCPEKRTPNTEEGNMHTQRGTSEVVRKIVVQNCNVDEVLKKYNEDVAAYSKEKPRKVNFGNLKRNCSSDSYAGSIPSFKSSFPVKRPLGINQSPSTSSLNTFNTILNNKSGVNTFCTRPIGNVLSEDTNCVSPVKNKFNFKRLSSTSSKEIVNNGYVSCIDNEKSNQDMNDCDSIVINSSQISVKPDKKEHVEIWKNLLEGVDTDSLFDDF